MSIRRFVIGTAGHVDHGKTSLVKALTGIDTDRLAEEKRRGISIELGFARWALAADLEATVVDVPGHRRFMAAMIAGASGIQLVLLVIAANEGVMPQTREHAHVCYELGIRRFIVVLSKSDLVDAGTLALAEVEARELIEELGQRADTAVVLDVVACSAQTGDGLMSLQNALIAAAPSVVAPALNTEPAPARLWIDRVLTLAGAGTVVTGTLTSGAVAVGDELAISSGDELKRATVRGLRIHSTSVQRAEATTRLAINVTIAANKLSRGDLVTSDLELRGAAKIDAVFRGAELRRGSVVMLHVGGARVSVRISRVELLEDTPLQLVTLHLSALRPIVGGDRFLLRGAATTAREGALLGGATVLDARPQRRARADARRALARALLSENAEQVVVCLLAETSPRPLDVRSLHGRFSLDDAVLSRAIGAGVKAGVLASCGAGVIGRAALLALAQEARDLVQLHARNSPLDRGFPIATLRHTLAERAGESAADAAIAAACTLAGEGAIRVDGDVVVLAARRGAVDAAVANATKQAEAAIVSAGTTGATAFRIGEIVGAEHARAVLTFLVREGRAIHTGDLWFAREVVDELRTRVLGHLSTTGKLTIAELKDLGRLPRKQAVLVLEYFDQTKVTRRVGDTRVLFSPAAKPTERGSP